MIGETFDFLLGIAAAFALFFVVVSFASSPLMALGMVLSPLWKRGHFYNLLVDPSKQASWARIFHFTTTPLAAALLLWWLL